MHGGLDQHGQALQQRAVHQRQGVGQVFQPRVVGDRLQLRAEFGDDFLQPFGLEDFAGLTERAQRRALATEFALHFPQLARLLDGPQGADHRIEQEQQHEQAILVEVQLPIAGLVALATHVMEACQQRSELVEILQARHVLFTHVVTLRAGHAEDYARLANERNTTCVGCVQMRKSRAEQDWDKSNYFSSNNWTYPLFSSALYLGPAPSRRGALDS